MIAAELFDSMRVALMCPNAPGSITSAPTVGENDDELTPALQPCGIGLFRLRIDCC